MPQASLLGWLSKPTSLQKPQPVKLSESRGVNDDTAGPIRTPIDVSSPTSSTEAGKQSSSESTVKNDERTLPPNVELRACTKDDIPHLKRLNSLLLPVPYAEKFYREITEDPVTSNITLVAVWHDDPDAAGKEPGKLVGAIRCRLLAHPPSPDAAQSRTLAGLMLYLSTLVLLSPYRGYGIATRMLDVLTKRAVKDHGILSVGAHVWEANVEGLEWYRKRGFREVGREGDYYRRLKPTGAVVMQRDVRIMEIVSG